MQVQICLKVAGSMHKITARDVRIHTVKMWHISNFCSVIKQEKDVTEMELEKSWEHGLVLTNKETLIDPNWVKTSEDKTVEESNRQNLMESPSVIVGVLRQWPVW